MNSLTTKESDALRQCEIQIEKGKTTFVSVGLALSKIRETKLYRESHSTFEEYCEKRWGWGIRRAQQLMSSAAVVQALPPERRTMVRVERQARALPRNGPTTARSIAPKPTQDAVEIRRDPAYGRKIPKELWEEWDRAEARAKELRDHIHKVKLDMEHGVNEKDIIFAEFTNATTHDLATLWNRLENIQPFCLCWLCQGRTRETCQLCKRRGWTSKFLHDSTASKQQRALMAEHAKNET